MANYYLMKKFIFPIVALLLLSFAIGAQIYGAIRPAPEVPDRTPLAEVLPSQIQGWDIEDMDLGPTESVTARSHDILRLDDFVNRAYAGSQGRFSVYVAYWKPGKMPVRLVNQHSPDRCWTEVGWVCTDRSWNVEKKVYGEPIQPGQWGVYEINGFAQETYFWHIVAGKAHWYGGERLNTRSSITSVFSDLINFGGNTHREQFFVRIVSQQSLDELWDVPAFQEVMKSLADLCLAPPEDQIVL